MEIWYKEVEESLELLKSYFKNKRSQGAIELNGQDVLAAFDLIYNIISMPKNTWIEHDGLNRPVLIEGQFGMVEFRDGEKRTCNLYTLPGYMWIHTEEPETMTRNSIEKRRKWNNQIVKFYIQEI